jgi:HK97 family phage portal protein
VPSTNGNGKHAVATVEKKSIPQIAPEVFWLNGNPADPWTPDHIARQTAYTCAAIAYICTHYRATKVKQAPLMVVEVTDAGEKWLPDHPLEPLLDRPNLDFTMRSLLEQTIVGLDNTGRYLWSKTRDRARRVRSLYGFDGDQFSSESSNTRLYASFDLDTLGTNGSDTPPEDVVLFQNFRPNYPHRGLAPLEIALSYLNLSQEITARIKWMLRNAAAPGGIYSVDKDAHLTDPEFERLKFELHNNFTSINTGKILIAEGGGKFDRPGYTLKELALGDLWREVEAIICACYGVPAAIVGVVVGLENSPWSHITTMEKSVMDNTIMPIWGDIEEILTLQLLREIDPDPRHIIRFDTSRIRALQNDDVTKAQVAANNARIWTLNQRLAYTGQPLSVDPRADLIPELENPTAPAPRTPPATEPSDAPPRGADTPAA